ncbi:hypothetical protein ILUMI_06783 [Ignelater luminosus]|uniref:Uncharacterized protein n=1 Tax=Ignelater luminosus TaxID=2038154 RepID=A0A8K0D9Z3_IGNLU|nr:hypothetical protein ILUMI_06783 [Ignelater luminosus]
MPSTKGKKSKSKLLKIDVSSSADSDESEHELSYYVDKVKLMKEVLKLIKPKKIKSMAPDCIKNLDIVEINSMLLEELLGISNKRLQYIFKGENVDRETSSSESEEEKQPIDVISLDDISDDDDIEFCIGEQEKTSLEKAKKGTNHKSLKIKTEDVDATIKTEKFKNKSKKSVDAKKDLDNLKENDKEKLMSVLELLELQARARAIRSQLAIENEQKKSESEKHRPIKIEEGSDSDAIIIESPEDKEIVITSDSEEENHKDILQDEAGPSSNIRQSNTDAKPPSKRQKSDSSQKQETEECTNKSENVIHSNKEIENVENLNKQNENVDSDNIKKQRLLAKIQKIKLVRNRSKNKKNVPHNSNEYSDNNVIDTSTVYTTPTEIINSDVATININTDEEQLHDNIKCSETECEDKNDLTKREESDKAACGDKEDQVIASTEATTIKKSANANFCDNDEIVINLDEDEMDGIE